MPQPPLAPSLDEVVGAAERIRGLVHRTPLLSSRTLGERSGLDVWLKPENLQKTGSFKPRGVFNKVLQLPLAARDAGIVTASAGNNGQAVAYVAAHENIPGFVVMPEGANRSKVAAVREYGSEAILHGNVWDDAFAHSLALAGEKGLTYVHPFKDRMIMAGQGTIALEILDDLPGVEAVLIPIGGGGLIGGVATAMKRSRPDVRIIGVEPEGAANLKKSHEAGRPIELDTVRTSADGLATKSTDPDVFEVIEATVDDYVTVTDEAMVDAIRFLLERTKLLAEVSGAATTAALLSGAVDLPPGTKTVAIVSGGNFDVARQMTLNV
jgi:threonine dehydratase